VNGADFDEADVGWLAQHVTIVVTTSPSRSDPELDLVHTTIASLELAGLSRCRQILVCDHFEEGLARGDDHSGRLPLGHINRYRSRLEAFRQAPWAADIEMLELTTWHGFAHATRRALELVETPLVCVVQHDVAFRRVVQLRDVAELLLSHIDRPRALGDQINFVCLPRSSNINYREKLRSRSGVEVGAPVSWASPTGRPVELTRLPQFFDGLQLASVSWYRDLFQQPLLRGLPIAMGQFTESNLGRHMMQLAQAKPSVVLGAPASQGVLEVLGEFGGWLWTCDEVDTHPLFHLDGRVFLSASERTARGIPDSHFRYRFGAAACAGHLRQFLLDSASVGIVVNDNSKSSAVRSQSACCNQITEPEMAPDISVLDSTRQNALLFECAC